MPECSAKQKASRKVNPNGAYCSLCFKPVYESQLYLWSKKKDGGYAFIHAKCLRGGKQ